MSDLENRVLELEQMLLLCSRHTGNEATNVDDVPEMIRLREQGKRNVIESQSQTIAVLARERNSLQEELNYEHKRRRDDEGIWLATRDANLRISAELAELKDKLAKLEAQK